MSDSDLVHNIVCFDIDIEEMEGDPLAHRKTTDAPDEIPIKQEKGITPEGPKDEESKVVIKKEIIDEPEDCEPQVFGGSLARRRLIYRRQRRDNGETIITPKNAEEKKDGEDKPKTKRKANEETGEDACAEGKNGEKGSGEGQTGVVGNGGGDGDVESLEGGDGEGGSEEGESGKGGNAEGEGDESTSSEGTSADGASAEKKAKTEEPSNVENDNSVRDVISNSNGNNKSAADYLVLFNN